MNLLSLKRILVIINLIGLLLVIFFVMLMDTAIGDTFSQVYDYINNLESSSYQSSTEKSEFLSDIGFFGVIAYFTGLFFVYTQRKLGKLILSIGLFLFILSYFMILHLN